MQPAYPPTVTSTTSAAAASSSASALSAAQSAYPPTTTASSTPSDLLQVNQAVLVDCDTIEPTCHVPGMASLYLPVERLLTLPGRHAFTQHLPVPSEQQAQTSEALAHGTSTDLGWTLLSVRVC
ncbi:hypothetical protein SCLCIDRAFT_26823 [Scleroderma citrinum Foug A]|uniref:Uncharacterized protein n=1 Tax=Scleroderma citrinum Foug A TaxID=1036808 RepID=A0A0C3DWA6_9AGAM|nr:hypothetical protein SCLCIDRAFT_26823 [Scleroderma citrinum Foug A]